MNQIRLSDLLPGKTFHWLEFFVRNIPNTRLESRIIPWSQCFRYLHAIRIKRCLWLAVKRSWVRIPSSPLQDVLFPDGLHYSPKTTEYRTSNIHLLLEITSCFIDTWTSEKNKTRRQNVFGSRVVAEAGLEPTTFGLWARRATNCSTPRYCGTNVSELVDTHQTKYAQSWLNWMNWRAGH